MEGRQNKKPPHRVGVYEIGTTIGQGRYGRVKRAVNTATKKQVAVKVLDKALLVESGGIESVKREISTLKTISHQNIVNMIEVLSTETKLYIVLELVNGQDLYAKIRSEIMLSEDKARFYFRQLILGLAHCHEEGICHRDLKCENLLIEEGYTLKIADFGFSTLHSDEKKHRKLLRTSCGTPHYAAPEVLEKEGYDGTLADIWSCGIILYTCLVGMFPFHDESLPGLFKKIKLAELTFPVYVSTDARDLIMNILKPNPEKRLTLEQIKNHPWMKFEAEKEFEIQRSPVSNPAALKPSGTSATLSRKETPVSAGSSPAKNVSRSATSSVLDTDKRREKKEKQEKEKKEKKARKREKKEKAKKKLEAKAAKEAAEAKPAPV